MRRGRDRGGRRIRYGFGRLERRGLGSIRQKVCARTQIGRGPFRVAIAQDGSMRDRVSHAEAHGFAAQFVKLARQADGSQSRMQRAGHLKRDAVGALEEHRYGRALGTERQRARLRSSTARR